METRKEAPKCPECGHEITDRGRYCPFCGCDLRKVPGMRTRSPLAVLLVILLALGCIFAAFAFIRSESRGRDPELRYGMTFREAAAEMERCGFVPEGEEYGKDGRASRNYKEHSIYGRKAWMITLEARKNTGGRVTLTTYFVDTDKGYTRKTSVFTGLKNYLTDRHGKPEVKNGAYEYYYWQVDDGFIILMDAGDMVMVGESHERSGGVS